MSDLAASPSEPAPWPEINKIQVRDLWRALEMGWSDFLAAPGYGLPFAAVYVLGGLFLTYVSGGFVWQTLILSLGFPLFAPFAAVAMYEVSRRIEMGEPLNWAGVWGAILRERNRQIPWLGAIIVIYFLFYSFLAHMIFALFMGMSTLTNVSTSYEAFLTPEGLTMITVELIVGAIIGLLLFSLTVFSLPLALHKEIDFISAMIVSFQAVKQNAGVMLVWAIFIGVTMIIAMLPAFMGLFVVLPVLGHASWHLYRITLRHPEDGAQE